MKLVSRFKIAFIVAALLLTLAPQQSLAVTPDSLATKTTWGKFVNGTFEAFKTPWPYVVIASCAIVGVGLGFGIKYLKNSKENSEKN